MMNSRFTVFMETYAKALGWSNRDIAAKTGFSESQISNLMHGHRRPTPEFVDLVADAMKLNLPSRTILYLAAAETHGFKVPVPPANGTIDALLKHIPA